jgi:hypothetical protein
LSDRKWCILDCVFATDLPKYSEDIHYELIVGTNRVISVGVFECKGICKVNTSEHWFFLWKRIISTSFLYNKSVKDTTRSPTIPIFIAFYKHDDVTMFSLTLLYNANPS